MSSPTPLFVDIAATPTVITARLVGPTIADRESDAISASVIAQIESNGPLTRAVVLDFGKVEFISSAGLGACINIRNATNKAKAKTVLYNMSPRILDGFKLCKLDRIFEIAGDEKKLAKLTK